MSLGPVAKGQEVAGVASVRHVFCLKSKQFSNLLEAADSDPAEKSGLNC